MNPISGKRRAGSFVAFGTDIRIPFSGMHGGSEMAVAGDRLVPMTLPAGDFSPHCMQAPGLPGMAADAPSAFIKPETHMGIGQIFSEPDLFGGWSQSDQFRTGSLFLHIWQIESGLKFIPFIACCAFFSTCIPISL